ncbi:MAG TPA: TonB-dependent receptor [Azospirillaceae bacterium]|nr:TonB-dependent receptor [Azospirillaceae bacterium]
MHTKRKTTRRPFTAALMASAAAAALMAGPATAQESQPEVVVTATRLPTPVDQVGSSISVITGAQIERSQQPNPLDLLKRTPGVSITRAGGVGSTANVRIRGSEPGQVKVLVDGIELNDPSSTDRGFDFNSLLVGGTDRIEVLRGPQSALYGNDAMGGVVNILTSPGEGPLTTTLEAEAGAFRTFRQRAHVGASGERWSAAVTGANLTTEGFSRVRAGGENDGAINRGAHGRFGFHATDDIRFDATLGYWHLDTEFDPLITQDGPASQTKDTMYGRFATTFEAFDDRLSTTLFVNGSRTDRAFDEPVGFFRFSTFDGWQRTLGLQSTYNVDGDDKLTVGAERRTEYAETTSTDGTGVRTRGLDDANSTNGLFAQYQLGLFDSLYLTAGLRRDTNENFGGSTTYRLAGAYVLKPTGTTFRASVGTAAKAPTLFQLHAPGFGNPELEVERSTGYEAGVEQSLLDDRVVLGATVFRNNHRDLIAFEGSTYRNVARARTQGFELTGTVRPLEWLEVSANYTLLDTLDLETDRELARRPRHTANLLADVQATDELKIGANLRYVGQQRDRAAANSAELAPAFVLDLLATYRLTDHLTAFGRVENLTNADYEEVRGYRTSGRAAYVGLRAAF